MRTEAQRIQKGLASLCIGGIGSAICQRLAKVGFRVVSSFRSEAKARKWQQEMTARGVDVALYPADVSDFEQCKQMIASIEADPGRIDVIVNNAGIARDTTLRKMERSRWRHVVSTTWTASLILCGAQKPVDKGAGFLYCAMQQLLHCTKGAKR